MKIGILGGTFDPIHEGHLHLAEAAKKQFHLDKILFIPAFIPPHKARRRDMTPAPYRYRMVELAIREEPAFEISNVELNRPDLSYTADTLRDLRAKYPKDELFLILGRDTFREVPKWRRPVEIRKIVHFIVAPRGEDADAPYPWHEGVSELQMKLHPASSSEIREVLGKGHALPPHWLPEAVLEYIQRMKLYQEKRS